MSFGGIGAPSFSGGVRFNSTSPPEVGQVAIPGFAGGGVQPVAGVQPKEANFARNNRGSNITIPHARVVPASQQLEYQLTNPTAHQPSGPYGYGDSATDRGPTTGLRAGQLAFVYAQRSSEDHIARTLKTRRTGGGVDRVDTLCSLAYLEAAVFSRKNSMRQVKTTDVETSAYADRGAIWTNGMPQTAHQLDFSDVATGGGIASAFADVSGPVVNMTDNLWSGDPTNALRVGLFTRDVHPFIRGKSFASGTAKMPSQKGRDKGGEVPRSIADQVAIALFHAKLTQAGLFDWQPDGVVLSKDHSSSDDVLTEREFDARLHELYNVAVQGPATTSVLTGESRLLTLPGDMVFVLMICDVVYDATIALSGTQIKDMTAEQYQTWRKAQTQTKTADEVVNESAEYFMGLKPQATELMVNFRLKVSTSCDMVHHSGVDCFKQANTPWTPKPTERMGLQFTDTYAEYVVGGWLIGRVLDSSTARTRVPGAHLINSDPTSYAVSVDVNVEWWSGDRLFRNFCDIEGSTMKTRGNPNSGPSLHFMNRTADENLNDPSVQAAFASLSKVERLFVMTDYFKWTGTLSEAQMLEFMGAHNNTRHFKTWWAAADKDKRCAIVRGMFEAQVATATDAWATVDAWMHPEIVTTIHDVFMASTNFVIDSIKEADGFYGSDTFDELTAKADEFQNTFTDFNTQFTRATPLTNTDVRDAAAAAKNKTIADTLVPGKINLATNQLAAIEGELAAFAPGTRRIPAKASYQALKAAVNRIKAKLDTIYTNAQTLITAIAAEAVFLGAGLTADQKTSVQNLAAKADELLALSYRVRENAVRVTKQCDAFVSHHAVLAWQGSDPDPDAVAAPDPGVVPLLATYQTP